MRPTRFSPSFLGSQACGKLLGPGELKLMNDPPCPKRLAGPGLWSSDPHSPLMSQPKVGIPALARRSAPVNSAVRDRQRSKHVVLAEESLHLLAVVRDLVITLRGQLELAAVDATLGAVDVVEVRLDAVERGLHRKSGRVVRHRRDPTDADRLVGHAWLVDRRILLAPAPVAPSRIAPANTATNVAVQRLAPRPRICVLDIAAPRDDCPGRYALFAPG